MASWSGPTKLPAFLETHWRVLAAAYDQPARQPDRFAIQGDGPGRLWVAYGSRVLALDGTGVKEWAVPTDSKHNREWFQLCRLPDGRMLLAQSNGDTKTLRALSVKEGEILVEKFPEPAWPRGPYDLLAAFTARDKTIWLTTFRPGDPSPVPGAVWRFHDGQWEERKDLRSLLYEEADGSLWFSPGWDSYHTERNKPATRLSREMRRGTFSAPRHLGGLTPTGDGRLLAACGQWFVESSSGRTR